MFGVYINHGQLHTEMGNTFYKDIIRSIAEQIDGETGVLGGSFAHRAITSLDLDPDKDTLMQVRRQLGPEIAALVPSFWRPAYEYVTDRLMKGQARKAPGHIHYWGVDNSEFYRQGVIVKVPTHNSHLDEIVSLNHLRMNRLEPYIVVGGVRITPMARFIGLYPIDRSRGKDNVYMWLQRLIVHEILGTGHNLAVAVQGSRSYSGELFSQPLQTGMLDFVLEFQHRNPDVPVYLEVTSNSYSFVPEDEYFVRVMRGAQKQPVRHFIQEVRDAAEEFCEKNDQYPLPAISYTHPAFALKDIASVPGSATRKKLASLIQEMMGLGVVAQPMHLLSSVLADEEWISAKRLRSEYIELGRGLEQRGVVLGSGALEPESIEPLIPYLKERGIVSSRHGSFSVENRDLLAYYGNMISHHTNI